MKKIITAFLAITLALSIAACGGNNSVSTSSPTSTPNSLPPQQSVSSDSAQGSQGSESEVTTSSENNDPIVNTATLEDFEKHPGDAEHMKPLTEDYFYYQSTHKVDDFVLRQQIHYYDEQGNCCGDNIKNVYSSEAAAKSAYDKPMYDAIRSGTALDGAVFYQTIEGGCGNVKEDDFEQFLYWQKYGMEEEKHFFSIPIK